MSYEPVESFLGLSPLGDFLGLDTELYGLKTMALGPFSYIFFCLSVF